MMLSRVVDGYFRRTQALFAFSAAAVTLTASSAFGQAPSVVVDAQQTIGSSFYKPHSVAAAPNGTVYVADESNNQVVELTTKLPAASTQTPVTVNNLQFAAPSALAVDANGDLFVGDYPNIDFLGDLLGFPRVTELYATNGVLNGTYATLFNPGSSLNFNFFLIQPSSLAVDSQNHVYVGLGASIYTVAGGNAAKLNITGLPSGFIPAAMVRNSATSLYFADSQAASGGVYVVHDTGGAAQPVATGYFAPENPTGLALDSSGDLFILSQLMVNGTASPQVFVIPAASTSTPYIIPSTGLVGVSGMALDPSGNIDVVEAGNGFQGNGLVTQLDYRNAINMGAAPVYVSGPVTPGPAIPFNFEFNAAATLAGFQTVTLGDPGAANDVVSAGNGSCANQATGSVSAAEPYICEQPFETVPRYTGTRVSAIQVNGPSSSILASSPVYETGDSGAQITYPLNQSLTATPLISPQGVAISGFNQKVYVADFGSGQVYSSSGLTGTGLTAVPTGGIALQAPSAVALNGEGDLYVADFGFTGSGKVIVVPTTTGKAPSVVNTGSLLEHPIALAVDYLGNLYIGDAGINGDTASDSSPGFVVKVPRNGVAVKMTIPYTGPTIIFPQTLATDGTGNLYIGDGGDGVSIPGQVVKVPANGTAASAVTVKNEPAPFNPVGLSVDAAGNLYVLDGSANSVENITSTITVVSPTGNNYQVGFVSSLLATPSAFASSAGGQSFVITNIGNGGSNSLIFLNGNSSTLAFGNVQKNTSANLTATVYNIGNEAFTLGTPSESGTGFSLLNSTCENGVSLNPATSCALNVQFSPTALQPYSGTIAIPSTAYNNGGPGLSLTGTGSTTTGSVELPATARRSTGGGRKSFQR